MYIGIQMIIWWGVWIESLKSTPPVNEPLANRLKQNPSESSSLEWQLGNDSSLTQ